MSKLVILDASVFLHAGSAMKSRNNETGSQQGKGYSIYGLQVGGLHMLFEAVARERQKYNDLIVVFDNKTTKKDMFPGYKANRRPNAGVLMQQHLALKVLERAGVMTLCEEGFEADDLIAKAVKDNYNQYGIIAIYSSDMDLAHNIDDKGKVVLYTPVSVSYNVERHTFAKDLAQTSAVKSVQERLEKIVHEVKPGVDVRQREYPYLLDAQEIVYFNTITVFKILLGDKSDNIGEFKYSKGTGLDVYYKFIAWAQKCGLDGKELSNAGYFVKFLKSTTEQSLFNEEEMKELANRIRIFFPKKVAKDCTYDQQRKIDHGELVKAFNLFRAKNSAYLLRGEYEPLTPSQTNWLKARAAEVNNGMIEVDYDYEIGSQSQNRFTTHAARQASQGENIGQF